MHRVSKYTVGDRAQSTLNLKDIPKLKQVLNFDGFVLTVPRESSLFPRLPELIKKGETFDPFPGEIVTITSKMTRQKGMS